MTQKTYHNLTASFIGAVVTTLPNNISTDSMQTWIENPRTLQRELKKMLESGFIVIHEDDKQYNGKLAMRILQVGDSPFHKQTAKFISRVIENIPEVSNEKMNFWMKHLNTLQANLHTALTAKIVLIDPTDALIRKKRV